MRKTRKLFLMTVVALATTGLTATSATAAVEIANPGEITLLDTMVATDNLYPACEVTIEGSVTSDGYIALVSVGADISPLYGSSACGQDQLNDCDNAGWVGQIIGPGDSYEAADYTYMTNVGYAGTGDYEAIVQVCFTGFLGQWPTYLRFSLDADENDAYPNWELKPQNILVGSAGFSGSGYPQPTGRALEIASVVE